MQTSRRWWVIVLVSACSGPLGEVSHTPATRAGRPAPAAAGGRGSRGPATGAAARPAGCLTVRDQELSCDADCRPIQPVLRSCARALEPIATPQRWYQVVVRTGAGRAAADVPRELGPQLPFRGCIERAMARFRPCLGPSGNATPVEVPLLVRPPRLPSPPAAAADPPN